MDRIIGFTGIVLSLHTIRHLSRLRVPDHLKKGPMSITDLAKATNVKYQSPLLQSMRLLSTKEIGWFKENKDGTFENTELSKTLIGGDSSEYHLIHMLSDNMLNSFSKLDAAFDGKVPYEVFNGRTFFGGAKDGHEEHFVKAMAGVTEKMYPIFLKFNFSRFKHIVDVGGLKGGLLQAIQKEYPSVKEFTLFDLPNMVPKSLPGIHITGGDFFSIPTQIPKGADCYIIKNVIHDWSDEKSIVILKNIQESMQDEGRVLLMEQILPPFGDGSGGYIKTISLMMTITTLGQERSLEEYKVLLNKAGLEIVTIHGEDKEGFDGIRIIEIKKKR